MSFAMLQSDLQPRTVASDPDALYAAACLAWREGQREEAIARIDEALRRRPDFAEALSMGGYMLSESGKPEAALRFYRQALNIKPSLVVAHVNSGKLLLTRVASRKRSPRSKQPPRLPPTTLTPGPAALELSANSDVSRSRLMLQVERSRCGRTSPKQRSTAAMRS